MNNLVWVSANCVFNSVLDLIVHDVDNASEPRVPSTQIESSDEQGVIDCSDREEGPSDILG
jgi:hypothetical protein